MHMSVGLISCEAGTFLFSKEYQNLVNRPTLESKLNEVVAKFALITVEEGEERLESGIHVHE